MTRGKLWVALQVSSSHSWPPPPLVRPQNATKANRRMPDIFSSLKSVYILRGSSWSPHTSVTAERMNKTFSPMTLVHQRDNDFLGYVLEYPHRGYKRVLTFAAWRDLQAPFSIVASARCFIFFLLQALHDLVIAQMTVCTFTWYHTPFSHSSLTVLFVCLLVLQQGGKGRWPWPPPEPEPHLLKWMPPEKVRLPFSTSQGNHLPSRQRVPVVG